MLDRNSDPLHRSDYLLTLPVESRIEYTEKLLDDLTRSIWGDSFSKRDKEKMERIADRTLHSVKQAKELALEILEED
jgi:hypothetical protein